MSILRLTGVTREVGTFVILDAIDASIALGDRIGLVGPNGAGKTTLLRLAAGRDEPDLGEVHRKRGLTLGLLAQEAHFDEAFMASPDLRLAVRTGAAHLDRMAERLAAMERDGVVTDHAYAELLHQYEVLGGYTLDQRVESALTGLGFTRDEWAKPPSALSGGEQTRASLARLVIADPDLLLLDEPTNHLDLDALEWLEEHLRRRSGSLLVASHDRAFLDATVTRIWELRDRRMTTFRGDYSAYHRQRVERDARAVKDVDTQAEQIAREKELIQRYRSHRKFSKQHEHEARLEKLEAERREAPKAGRKLAIPTVGLVGGTGPSRSGEIVVRVEGLAVGYLPGRGATAPDGSIATEAKIVSRAPFLAAQRGERIGIVGPNGAGKTTLLRTIAGDLPPLDGTITFGNAVQIGYLAQLRSAAIAGATVLDALIEAVPVTQGEARAYLARFLFRGDDAFKEVRLLSGGERSRLELALLGIQPSNLLLLDEPTNHLDIPAREAIEAFMAGSPATLLVVSHDRRLLETVCEKLWVVGDGAAVAFDGGYREWRAAVATGWTVETALELERARGRGRRGAANALPAPYGAAPNGRGPRVGVAAAPPGRPAAAAAGTPPPPNRSRKREKLSKEAYRRQKAAAEGELTRLGLRKSHLELAMGDPAVQANFVEMRRVTSELADIDVALAAAEDAWLDLEERAP
jgi:ATP-binding cassette subfamily F protein 3